ncbi:hypothetical protein MN608_11843 [Microdochium nivale]|nr:hypothetical protein MN608_11843 [Microdochium nivale]
MKRDPDGRGITGLGFDGVLRTFDKERDVVDAVGLNPAQIREYYEGLPMHERFLTADGRNISHEKWFHPDAENIPKKPTEEEIAESAARFEGYRRSGLICSASDKSADGGKSKS